MSLPITVDSLDGLPEPVRTFYKEENGKFSLDLEGYEDPANLKSALQKEREAVKLAAKEANAFKAFGKSPEEIEAMLQASAKAEQDKLAKSGDFDAIKKQMTDQWEKERQTFQERIAANDKAIESHLIDSQATSAIASAKGVPALLMPHLKQQLKVVSDNGNYAVRVLGTDGNPRVNGNGEFLSISDLVGEMRQSEVFGRAFEATGTTGSGAMSSAAPGKAMTLTEQHMLARKNKGI